MLRYAILVYWNDMNNSFIAEVPELPGCMASGASYEEAVSRVGPVIAEWIKNAKALNREIPHPKGRLKVKV
ncbi:MAG: type II toxin-antitoxin system HicB family antitoxin [Spirochaetales bacterium]|nr:type II toxin-antitoxin system HicB family antitoxin [Spirochaetales bacterium]